MQRVKIKTSQRYYQENLYFLSIGVCLVFIFICHINTLFAEPAKHTGIPSSQLAAQVKYPNPIPDDPIMGNVRSIEFKGLSGQGLTKLQLLDIQVELTQVGDAYRAVQNGQPVLTIRLADITRADYELDKKDAFHPVNEEKNKPQSENRTELGYFLHASAMKAILDAISRTYQKHKIAGVRVNITRSAIEHLQEQKNDGILTINILEGKVTQVRALPTGLKSQNKSISPLSAKGEGNESHGDQSHSSKIGGSGDDKDPLCERIRDLSAVQPGQLIRLDVLDRYIAYLNRHPGRQVDVALVPGPQEGELTLDYLLSEIKQPMFYSQISNTGTEQTSRCREQFGLIHHNLTRRDDTLYVDYITGNFDSVHGVSGGYEWPLGSWVTGDDVSKRRDYHDWTWGDWTRARAKLFGSWREYEAAEVGLARQTFRGESYSIGGELAWNFFQHRASFIDVVAGLQHSRVKVDNDLTGLEGKSSFLLPYFGLRAVQQTDKANVNASLIAEFNLPEAASTDDKGLLALDRLGRVNTDRKWLTWRYALNTSFFLEPILDKNWRVPEHHSTLAHELFTSVRGQITPHNRRVPANYMQTLGGFYTIRGYPESFSAGDSSFLGTVEYRFHLPRSLQPKGAPAKIFGKSFRLQPEYELGRPDWDLVFRSFFDFGHTHKNDKLNFERDLTLISSGLGVELSLRSNIKIRTDWGWPLKSAYNGEDHVSVGNSSVHMSLSVIF